MMSPSDRADLALLLLYLQPRDEHIATLQAMQQLVQSELARLWREQNPHNPGHALEGIPRE